VTTQHPVIRRLWRTAALLPVVGVGFIFGVTIITTGRRGVIWAVFMVLAGLLGFVVGMLGHAAWLARPSRKR